MNELARTCEKEQRAKSKEQRRRANGRRHPFGASLGRGDPLKLI